MTATAKKINNQVTWIRKEDGTLTVFVSGKVFMIQSDHINYDLITETISNQTSFTPEEFATQLSKLCNVVESVTEYSNGLVEIRDGKLFIGGKEANEYTSGLAIGFYRKGLDFTPIVNFFTRLASNPSERSRNELLGFLIRARLPICADGSFIAYKAVKSNFMDIHSGTVSYALGNEVTMPRHLVDSNRNRTCSSGLHFASAEYDFGDSDRDIKIAVKVDPADVVSIPSDYNESKGRACRLISLCQIDWDTKLEGDFWDESLISDAYNGEEQQEEPEYEVEEYEDEEYEDESEATWSDEYEDEEDEEYEDEEDLEEDELPMGHSAGYSICPQTKIKYHDWLREIRRQHSEMSLALANEIRRAWPRFEHMPTKAGMAYDLNISPRQLGRILERECWC